LHNIQVAVFKSIAGTLTTQFDIFNKPGGASLEIINHDSIGPHELIFIVKIVLGVIAPIQEGSDSETFPVKQEVSFNPFYILNICLGT
jgi:hypothetical protein